MMIAIMTKTANAAGYVIVNEKKISNMEDLPARVSRTKLLDGGVHIDHSGVWHGDRTVNVSALMAASDRSRLKAIYITETLVYVATSDGFFDAAISHIRQNNADTVITILIKDKESE